MRVLAILVAAVVGASLAAPDAGAGKRKRRKRANMPQNWAWPPNKQMKAVAAACTEELTALNVAWKPGPRTRAITAPVIVESMTFGAIKLTPIFRRPPFVIDCHLAVALTKVSKVLANSGIAELRFSTIHQYRRVRLNGRTKRALSRHALGLAVDVYELVTTEGEKIVVKSDYETSDHARAVEAALIRSEIFRAILTPGNDPRSHYDHFHLEARMEIPTPRQARKSERRARGSKRAKRAKKRANKTRKKKRRRRARRR